MEAQKRYARQLLTHLNPYTKLTYAEDPAVALVEINNENGLIHTWMSGSFDVLPDVFAQDLRIQWNEWLAKRYVNTTSLSNSWGTRDEPLATEMLVNARLAQKLEGWNTEQHQGAAVDSSVENRNIRLPKAAEFRTLPAGGRQDWIRFLWETERKHWAGMRRFLTEELGVKVPIVGTIVATSTPNLMAGMDVVDSHAYWQHPQFPGKDWDMNNWFVKNISMVDYPDSDTMTRLAFQRVAGKPHMVSEYNHPAPNMHAGEGPLFIAAFGALQDWDAIFLYTYSHEDKETKAGCIPSFFSIGPHPTIMANVPVASLLFRRGDLRPAKQLLHVPLPPEKEIGLIAQKGHAWGVLPVDQLGLDLKNASVHRIALDLSGKSRMPAVEPVAKDEQTSDTGELSWRLPGKDRGVLELRGSKTKAVIGHIDNQSIDLGHGVQVIVGATRSNWCTISLTLLEGDSFDRNPRRALLVATGVTENTNMGWKNATRNTVGRDWGKPPSLVESISATVELPRGATMPVIYPLDDRGQRGQGIPVTAAGDSATEFKIGPPHGTVWYEIDYAGAR